MKNVIFMIAAVLALAAGTFVSSCDTPAQKVDKAETNLDDAKQDLKDAKSDANAEARKAALAEEWRVFKGEAEMKIKTNEARIAELKSKMKTSGKALDALYAKSVDALEERNKALQARIDAYGKGQSDWDVFKREFNHDMDGLGQAFTDLTVNNKK